MGLALDELKNSRGELIEGEDLKIIIDEKISQFSVKDELLLIDYQENLLGQGGFIVKRENSYC